MSEESESHTDIHVDDQPTEITVRGLLIVLILSTIMSASNAYLGLYIGLTISVSIPAAILAVSILKPFGTSLQEINAIQTGSSAGSLVSTGMIYSLPALIIIGYWDTIQWGESATVALVGGVLGVLFSIPIRRALIVEQPLEFPEGAATAEVLKVTLPSDEGAKDSSRKGLLMLVVGALIGATMKMGSSTFYLWDNVASWAVWLSATSALYFGVTLSPALTSIGFIVGIKSAILMLTGSIICWWVATPLTMLYENTYYPDGTDGISAAFAVWSEETRYIGIGAMLFGGLATILMLSKAIAKGVMSGVKAFSEFRRQGMASVPRHERDIPIPVIGVCIVISVVPLFLVCWYFTDIWYVGVFSSTFMLVFGFLFACVGAYMAGLVGSSQSPVSGVTLATVITASLLLLLFLGTKNPLGPPSAILIGAVICCAASVSGDSMQDLKTGSIVGSTPYKQQIMQIVGVVVPALILPFVLSLILQAYGIGEPTEEHPEPLIAPQANLVADISHAIFFGGAPYLMVGFGGVLAITVVVLDLILLYAQVPFRLHILSLALGLYLPFENNATVFTGALVASGASWCLKKVYGPDNDAVEDNLRFGVLFAAGVITGEALAGIIFAIPVVVSGNVYLLSYSGGPTDVVWPGLILLLLALTLNFLAPTYPALRKRFGSTSSSYDSESEE